MAADWEEVKRLAADFQKAQLGSTVQKLSERNCIEIIKKLLELKLIEVIFTNDGKEYVTPQRLQKEISDELIFHGGRVNLADLPQIIGVDFSHIEAKAIQFSRSEPDVHILLGQLITREYLDHIAEEVNEKLQQAGQITIAELTKQYDLPGDFLEKNIHERLETIIQGHADANDSRTIFTDSYVAQHKARIQGVLSALTRPVSIATLISHFKFPEKLFFAVAENLMKGGRLAGSLSGGKSERALYIPDLYAKSQSEWVDAFYRQNGYLEYDSLSRLGIPDPKAYITKRYTKESLTFLRSCCVGKAILTQVEVTIEEALNTGSWVDIMPLLPSVFNSDDCQQIIASAIKSLPKQSPSLRVFCNSVVVSDVFMNSCLEIFEPLMKEKAHEDIMKYPQYFAASHTVVTKNSSKREETTSRSKTDKKEERRKKGGKAGGGTQGRETKIRSVKKKYHTGRCCEDSGSEEEGLDSQVRDNKITELEFMDVAEIEKKLEEIPSINECPENLISALAEEFRRPLSKRYQDVAKSIYVSVMFSSGSSRRKLHAEFQEKASTLLNHIYMFEKGIKLFSEDVSSQLVKHILKTLCTDITNMCVNYLAGEHGICADTDINTDLSTEARQNIIKKLPEDVRQHTSKLHVALTSKTLEDFQTNIEIVLGAGVCDAMYRKIDKKAERTLLSIHRQSLLTQLSDVTDPALCLHLAVLLIFQTQTNHMLHASGKFVPQIISLLQKHLPLDIYKILAENQELVIQRIMAGENAKESEELDAALKELMPKIKDTAISYKKGPVSDVQ